MKGTVDTDIVKSLESAGMQVQNIQSEWIATLQERDMEFENVVERFAQEPIPANLTWDYVNNAREASSSASYSWKTRATSSCVPSFTATQHLDPSPWPC